MNVNVVPQTASLVWITPEALKVIEYCGRTCYKSENDITDYSSRQFVKMLLDRGHESVLEHAVACYKLVCDRGVSHELVRHRIASYSQESTRYVNYNKKGMQFVIPPDLGDDFPRWVRSVETAAQSYNTMISHGIKPEIARSVLPNSLKTEIVATMNTREWRHFFRLRTDKKAHPQMRQLAGLILNDLSDRVPVVFDEFKESE